MLHLSACTASAATARPSSAPRSSAGASHLAASTSATSARVTALPCVCLSVLPVLHRVACPAVGAPFGHTHVCVCLFAQAVDKNKQEIEDLLFAEAQQQLEYADDADQVFGDDKDEDEVGDFGTDEVVAKVRSLSLCRSRYARSVWLCTYVMCVCVCTVYIMCIYI